jgi:hypothetical protein
MHVKQQKSRTLNIELMLSEHKLAVKGHVIFGRTDFSIACMDSLCGVTMSIFAVFR